MAKLGKVVILSGASSIGKGEIKKELLADPSLALNEAISMTTRPKKGNEVDGRDYYFVDYRTFADAVKNKELLEYTEFNGYYYGTPRAQVESLTKWGKNVLIEANTEGVGPLKLNIPEALAIYIVPESMEELEDHIMAVYGDDMASAQRRINKARMEMEMASLFNNQVKKASVEECVADCKNMITEFLNKD